MKCERNTLQCEKNRPGPTGDLATIKRMSQRDRANLDPTRLGTSFPDSRSIIDALHKYANSANGT